MYEKNGEKYFVVDAHCHFWDASEENWVPGSEQYAKGWIDCFYGYHQLGPPQTHWDHEHFMKVSEDDFARDMFEEGHVDVAIFQSTYLNEWYRSGFNTAARNHTLTQKYPDRLITNGRFDPRDGDVGLRQLEEDAKRYELKGVKVYTAEWNNGSRGWKLSDPEAYRFLEKCQELGIKNVHAHKGPTIWPLDKDAFDAKDVDQAATDFPDLNFLVEHAGIPRIDDFCYMAVQEPNVYAGCSVVLGALMHARPKFFAKVMGELLFWVGEDRMTFGSDYNIWTPKWQVEGFVDWQMPDDEAFSDYPRLTTATKKKILGLNAARLYDIPVPQECRLEGPTIPTQASGSSDPSRPAEQLVGDQAGAGA
ncbi:MAG TPA: amidohydrolase family protein [Pseudonocardia sp.]|jgi:predicted TIM-barrel fold metal-dependent hydrolase|nr:amidohydrolase family protein [Pseudonocardia sp.]